jgi:hypothetical protein
MMLIALSKCKNQEQVKYFEGVLIYETDDQMLENLPVDSARFIKYFVKGNSIRVESITAMGKQVHLRDDASKSGVLIFVFAGRKVALLQDLSLDTINRGFHIETLSGSKKIAGLHCKKAKISGGSLDKPIEIYYNPKYPNHILEIYDRIVPGLPTQYQLIVHQMPVNYTLVSIEHQKIDPQKFSIPNDCIVMTMEEFMELLPKQMPRR